MAELTTEEKNRSVPVSPVSDEPPVFRQIHLDVSRNATDDFNPFHDRDKWQRIPGNPFGGPIVLGFQLECLIEYLVTRLREREGHPAGESSLAFRNYQFSFVGALRPDVPFTVQVKPTLTRQDAAGESTLSNRVALRTADALVLLGQVRDSVAPLALPDVPAPDVDLRTLQDRALLPAGGWFHKRKFMLNSNAKNMIAGSLADQAYYFDEIEDRGNFPDLFPVSLVSCALLEQVHATGHDFYADPMVYTHHHISVDQRLARALRSNDTLHLLVKAAEPLAADNGGLGRAEVAQLRHQCFGLLAGHRVLFRAEVMLAPLAAITGRASARGPACGR